MPFPAFLALVAEPLFLLADAAIVGHLGTPQLAGLGDRRRSAADRRRALRVPGLRHHRQRRPQPRRRGPSRRHEPGHRRHLAGRGDRAARHRRRGPAHRRCSWHAFGAGAAVSEHATTYLRIAFLGTTPLLVMLATTGVLRGLQDTRTPLVVAVAGNVVNVVLNLLLVYGAGLRRTGHRRLRPRHGPRPGGQRRGPARRRGPGRPARGRLAAPAPGRASARRPGGGAAVRSGPSPCASRCCSRCTPWCSPRPAGGGADLAAHQLALTIWTFLAFALDAIAIAAQAITGRALGAGDVEGTRRTDPADDPVGSGQRRGDRARLLAATARGWAPVHRGPGRARLLTPVLVVAALGQPLAGVVFVLDGVLIGAGDGRYLAWAGLAPCSSMLPLALRRGRCSAARCSGSGSRSPAASWLRAQSCCSGARAATPGW